MKTLFKVFLVVVLLTFTAFPSMAEDLKRNCERLYYQKDFDKAISHCQKALEADLKDADLYYYIADSYVQTGEFEKALEWWNKANKAKREKKLNYSSKLSSRRLFMLKFGISTAKRRAEQSGKQSQLAKKKLAKLRSEIESLRKELEREKQRTRKQKGPSTKRKDVASLGKLKAIKPFGSLDWSDGIVEVVTKLNNIKGIEEVYIYKGYSKLDVKGITTKEALKSKLVGSDIPGFGLSPRSCKGIEGKVYSVIWGVRAFPVILANIPFTLSVILDSAPALMIAAPEKALGFTRRYKGPVQYGKEPKVISEKVFFPLLIKGVYLESKSPALDKNFLKLKKIIVEKYKQYKKFEPCVGCDNSKLELVLKVTDGEGGGFQFIKQFLPMCKISYESEIYRKKLIKAYKDHLSKLESEAFKGKQDMGSSL